VQRRARPPRRPPARPEDVRRLPAEPEDSDSVRGADGVWCAPGSPAHSRAAARLSARPQVPQDGRERVHRKGGTAVGGHGKGALCGVLLGTN
jgi:hypothetical protein